MNIYRTIEHMPYLGDACLTVGTFDGVHLAHQAIIQTLVACSREKGSSVVVTFHPHPQQVLNPDGGMVQMLTTLNERLALLESLGTDYVLVLPFTKELARLSAEQFIVDLLHQKIGIQSIFMGFNHAFGKKAEGSEELLKKLGQKHHFTVQSVAAFKMGDQIVSSTAIRQCLNEGDVNAANLMLNRCYHMAGKVVSGMQIGNTIGFPTANLDINVKDKLIPADGVYAVIGGWNDQMIPGMVNIGFRPTIEAGHRTIEVHLFDFENNIYGDRLDIHFVARIRDEKKFESLEALRKQLEVDKLNSQQCLEDRSKEAFDGFNQRRKS